MARSEIILKTMDTILPKMDHIPLWSQKALDHGTNAMDTMSKTHLVSPLAPLGIPQTILLSVVLTVGLVVLVVGTLIGVHLMYTMVRRRNARVFISYQGEQRGKIAEALLTNMKERGIYCRMVPFDENPDHNEIHNKIVRNVQQEIDDCNLCICIPASKETFVSSEVLAVSQVKKPILLLLHKENARFVPNTFLKGYPIFDLDKLQLEGLRKPEGLQPEGLHTLAKFCSYLVGDWRSTFRLYGAAFNHIRFDLAIFTMIIYSVIIALFASPMANVDLHTLGLRGPLQAVISNPATFVFLSIIFLLFILPYILFSIKRSIIQASLTRKIRKQEFAVFKDSYLSQTKTLSYSLTSADLREILYLNDVISNHEAENRQVNKREPAVG